jgi:hypothetical protein
MPAAGVHRDEGSADLAGRPLVPGRGCDHATSRGKVPREDGQPLRDSRVEPGARHGTRFAPHRPVLMMIEDSLGLAPVRTPDERWIAFRSAEGALFVSGRPPHWWWRKEVRRTTSQSYSLYKATAGPTNTDRVSA